MYDCIVMYICAAVHACMCVCVCMHKHARMTALSDNPEVAMETTYNSLVSKETLFNPETAANSNQSHLNHS